ncbi:hypothetical protein MASR2M15_11640 [Anaerolineales bacterium]
MRTFIAFLSILFLISACAPDNQNSITELPTLVAFPTSTLTETKTPTPTFTASVTPSVTPSPTATVTASITPSPTLTKYLSPTPTNRPKATATNTLTATPTATATSSATVTPDVPQIFSFIASATSINANSPVTFTWAAQGSSARIDRIDASGVALESTPVPLEGTLSMTVPGGASTQTYRLVVIKGSLQDTANVIITLTCSPAWFFNPTTEIGCAIGNPLSLNIIYQAFQNGFMFRINYNGDRVCGVQYNLSSYTCSTFQTYTGTPPVSPPPGFFEPAPDFQSLYYNGLATGGQWYNVIGWGTGTSTAITQNVQEGRAEQAYIQLPVGVYEFNKSLSNGPTRKVD